MTLNQSEEFKIYNFNDDDDTKKENLFYKDKFRFKCL